MARRNVRSHETRSERGKYANNRQVVTPPPKRSSSHAAPSVVGDAGIKARQGYTSVSLEPRFESAQCTTPRPG